MCPNLDFVVHQRDLDVCCAGERPMRRDPDSMLRVERERGAARSDHKAVWSAVLAAGSGDCHASGLYQGQVHMHS